MKLQVKQIIFTNPFCAEYLPNGEIDLSSLSSDAVIVKTIVSTISSGTEKANYIGENNVLGNVDYVLPFPRYAGYSGAGEVIAVGSGVKSVKVKDRVVISNFRGQHKTYVLLKESNVIKIPEGVDYEESALSFIASFSLAGLRKVKLEAGESCLIMGLGILGQFAVKFARAMGAYPIIAVDPIEKRRDMALLGGADFVFNPFDNDFISNVKDVTKGGVKTAIEVTGVGSALNQVLDLMKPLGRIALLGCTRNSDFSVDYYKKVHSPGITLIGAHTNARPQVDSYPHYFTQNDEVKVILDLILGKRLTLKDVVSETHSPTKCAVIYDRLVNDKNFPVGVQFDWRNEL